VKKQNLLLMVMFCFCKASVRTDFPGSNHQQLLQSIKEQLLVLPDETIVYPGHGPHTPIGNEKKYNPYLKEIV